MSNEKMDDFEAVKYIAEKGMKIKNADEKLKTILTMIIA